MTPYSLKIITPLQILYHNGRHGLLIMGRPVPRPATLEQGDPCGIGNDVHKVRELAHVLGRLTKQKEVGLETMGRFHVLGAS